MGEIRVFGIDPGGTTGFCYGTSKGGHFDLDGFGECELALFELERLSCQIVEWLGLESDNNGLSVVGADGGGGSRAGSSSSGGILGAGSGGKGVGSSGNVGGRGSSGGMGWLVVEDFVLYVGARPGGTKFGGLAPVYVMGVLDGFLWDLGAVDYCSTGSRRKQQLAAHAKGVITDSRLRSLGLWVRGSAHVRDAIRHAELCCRQL